MKRKKNRPLFPNGYNVLKKVKQMSPKKIKISIQDQIVNILSKARNEIVKRGNYNIDLFKTGQVKSKYLGAFEKYEKDFLKKKKTWFTNLIKSVKSIKRVSSKVMTRFENIWRISGHIDDTGIIVYDKETAFKQMVLTVLKRNGVDITNPSELNKALGFMDISDLYDMWANNKDDEEEFYDDFSDDPLKFIKDIKKTDTKLRKQKQAQNKLFNQLKKGV